MGSYSYRWNTRWWSLVRYLNVDPSPPMSTLRLPDVIHVIGVPRPSPFCALFRFRVLYLTQTKEQKTGNAWERRLSESWDDWLWQFVSNTYVYHRGSPCRQKQLPVIWTKVNIYASNHLHMYPPKTTSILVGSCFHLFESNFKPYTLTTLLFISLLVLRLLHQSCSKTN